MEALGNGAKLRDRRNERKFRYFDELGRLSISDRIEWRKYWRQKRQEFNNFSANKGAKLGFNDLGFKKMMEVKHHLFRLFLVDLELKK